MKPFDYTLSERSEVAALLPDRYRTVLEVGCAKGGFRSSLNADAEVWGIEPNAAAAQMAPSDGYRMLVGSYEMVAEQCPESHFDLVVCNDVIEHMSDHDKFLEDIKKKLKPGGVMVGSVPNVRHFGNLFKLVVLRDWAYADQGVLDRTHLRFFTQKSLLRTFLAHGYAVERLVGLNSDFGRRMSLRQVGKNGLLAATILLSAGYFHDLRFIQYGFRVRLA